MNGKVNEVEITITLNDTTNVTLTKKNSADQGDAEPLVIVNLFIKKAIQDGGFWVPQTGCFYPWHSVKCVRSGADL